MGISGLLPFLKKASRPANVSEFSGKTAAIDVYCWLHKGAFGCADKLVQNQYTDGYITYVMKYCDMLVHYNIKPILVFDGRNLPSKSETEKKRRENRKKNRQLALDYLREGRVREARECFQRCIDITPAMARDVIEGCRERNIDCIVAPYEADAQLAFLNLNGIADFVISEDSDLAPFGCNKILFKMDISGNGILIEKDKINVSLGIRAENFTFEKFRYMCIMAGCDYHPSLPGIGIGKSCKFWGKVANTDLTSVLQKIPSYLNMSLEVTSEYIRGFLQADDTFLYQLVFDPRTRTLRPLNDYPSDVDERNNPYPFCGSYLPADLAYQMALGNVDLNNLDVVSTFDPDEDVKVNPNFKPRYGRRLAHASIWWKAERRSRHLASQDEATNLGMKKKADFQKAFALPTSVPDRSYELKRKLSSPAHNNVDLNGPEDDQNGDDIVSSYKTAKKSRLESPAENSNFEVTKKSASPEKRKGGHPSTPIISKEKIVYVSKYFARHIPGIATTEPANQEKIDSTSPLKIDESDEEEIVAKKMKSQKRKSGDWLSELENNVPDRNAAPFTSTPEVIPKSANYFKSDNATKENVLSKLTKLTALPPLITNPAARKAFKPTEESNNGDNKEDFSKKRNPFAKKNAPSSHHISSTHILSTRTSPTGRCSSHLSSQPPVEIRLTQLNFSGSDHDHDETASPPSRESTGKFEPKFSPLTTAVSESPYFASKKKPEVPNSTPGPVQKTRIPVSGLMKRGPAKKSDVNQPKIFDLWGKKKC